MTQETELSKKKPYREPRLIVYGTLTESTRANSMIGSKDGGPNNTKTS
jgi:hypothetical protein